MSTVSQGTFCDVGYCIDPICNYIDRSKVSLRLIKTFESLVLCSS